MPSAWSPSIRWRYTTLQENSFDEKLAYQTLNEAQQIARQYVSGEKDEDGFQYEGAAVWDLQERQWLHVEGHFPVPEGDKELPYKVEDKPEQAQEEQAWQEHSPTVQDKLTQKTNTPEDLTDLQKKALEIAKRYEELPVQEKMGIIARIFGCTAGQIETFPCTGKWRGYLSALTTACPCLPGMRALQRPKPQRFRAKLSIGDAGIDGQNFADLAWPQYREQSRL